MHDSRINYVVVGAFVSIMLAVFVVVISTLAGRSGATDEYYTIYDNVGGLKFGTLVLYEGYQIGQVDGIEPIIDGNQVSFRVNMSVQEGWRIPSDSLARATVSGLLSAMTIDIAGGESTVMLEPGSRIDGVAASNFFAALSEIGAEFGDLSQNSLKPLIANLNDFVMEVQKTTMSRLPVIMQNLEQVSASLSQDVPQISASLRRTADLIETDVLKPENRQLVDSILTDVASVAGELDETQALLSAAMQDINKMVDDNAGNVDESIRSLRYTLDTIARHVDDIAHNAATTSRNMAEFSRAIRENPGLLISGKPQSEAGEGGTP